MTNKIHKNCNCDNFACDCPYAEKAKFEKWAELNGQSIESKGGTGYTSIRTNWCWRAWKGANMKYINKAIATDELDKGSTCRENTSKIDATKYLEPVEPVIDEDAFENAKEVAYPYTHDRMIYTYREFLIAYLKEIV